jgi:hypothetical protein
MSAEVEPRRPRGSRRQFLQGAQIISVLLRLVSSENIRRKLFHQNARQLLKI